jgi:hypothetical protein
MTWNGAMVQVEVVVVVEVVAVEVYDGAFDRGRE